MHYGNYGSFYENTPSFIKKRITIFLENASYIIFVSNYQKNETLSKINITNKNIKVIYNNRQNKYLRRKCYRKNFF